LLKLQNRRNKMIAQHAHPASRIGNNLCRLR
jgi:hypothetical protein